MQRPSSPTRRARRLLAIGGAAVVILAACGGDDDDASSSTEAAAAPSATDAPATDAPTTTDPPATTGAPAAAGGAYATETTAGAATVAVAESSLGEILVDGDGMTLYMFVPDAQGPSTCEGGCLAAWPAVPGPATAGDGVEGARLGVAARSDGSEQATCDGWPLYTFAQDTAAGDVTGQGSGGKWYVLDATCTPVGME